jgi:hypothetical protein
VYDGALGNNAGLQTVKQLKLYLVSKLRHDSMLYFPFAGKYSGKGKPGRPKGSKNKNRTEVELSAFQLQLQNCIRQALGLIGGTLKIGHFVYDGALGNNAGLQTVKQLKLYLVSKLRHDSMLYFPFTGKYSGKGKPKKYGEKLTLETLPEKSLRETTVKKTSKPSIIRFRFGTRISPTYSMSWSLLKRTLKRARSQRFCYSAMT